jgi:hypothetical protein
MAEILPEGEIFDVQLMYRAYIGPKAAL